MPNRVGKGIRIGPQRVRDPPSRARNRKKHLLNSFSIILDPALKGEKIVDYLSIFVKQ